MPSLRVLTCVMLGVITIGACGNSDNPMDLREGCHASYPDVCIPPPPPDLNCSDIQFTNFRVLGADPHHLDADDDGIGCEEDEDLGFTGPFDLVVTETVDTCDGDENIIFSQVDISGSAEDITVRFSDDAVLTGGLNQANFFEVSGNVIVAVPVGDDTVDVESFMEMIYQVTDLGRHLEIVEGSSQIFTGTHPAAPGVTCIVEFVGQGQRPQPPLPE